MSVSAREYRTLDSQLHVATTTASSPDNVTAGNGVSVCDSGVDSLAACFSVVGLGCRGVALEPQLEEVYNNVE